MVGATEPSVLQEMIKQWKAEHKAKPRPLDFEMFQQILKMVNESSAVKVARNPLDEDHDWIPETTCLNVGKISQDDEGHLVLHVRHNKTEYSVDKLLTDLRRVGKKLSLGSSIMAQVSEKKVVQITDVYSHALVKDSWAGLPFDLVFAYYEKDEKKEEKKENTEA
jgi:hypothetical protein